MKQKSIRKKRNIFSEKLVSSYIFFASNIDGCIPPHTVAPNAFIYIDANVQLAGVITMEQVFVFAPRHVPLNYFVPQLEVESEMLRTSPS